MATATERYLFDARMVPTEEDIAASSSSQHFLTPHHDMTGSYIDMFDEERAQPGYDPRDNNKMTTTPLKMDNPLVTDTIHQKGQRHPSSSSSHLSKYASLSDVYWQDPWEVHRHIEKPSLDWNLYQHHVAHSDDIQDLWFR